MGLLDISCRKRKKKTLTEADCTKTDLIQFSCDHLKTSEELYTTRDNLHYLHSAAFLAHLSIELLLKAFILYYQKEFPPIHNLKRLFKPLKQRGINLSDHNKVWFNTLKNFNSLRYPDHNEKIAINKNQKGKTTALFNELWEKAPKEIQLLIIEHYRYPSSEKRGLDD